MEGEANVTVFDVPRVAGLLVAIGCEAEALENDGSTVRADAELAAETARGRKQHSATIHITTRRKRSNERREGRGIAVIMQVIIGILAVSAG